MVRATRSGESLPKEEFSKLVQEFIQGCKYIGGVVEDKKGVVNCHIGFRPKYEEEKENRIGLRGVEEVRPSGVLTFDSTGISIDKMTGDAHIIDDDVGGFISNPTAIRVFAQKEPMAGVEPHKELIVERRDVASPSRQSISMRRPITEQEKEFGGRGFEYGDMSSEEDKRRLGII